MLSLGVIVVVVFGFGFGFVKVLLAEADLVDGYGEGGFDGERLAVALAATEGVGDYVCAFLPDNKGVST